MKTQGIPLRIFAEIMLILAVGESAVMFVLPLISQGLSETMQAVMDSTLLVLIAGPLIYWRSYAAAQRLNEISGQPNLLQLPRARSAFWIAGLSQVLGLALTAGGTYWQYLNIESAAQARFDRAAERLERETARRFDQPQVGLKGLRGAFLAHSTLDVAEFRAHVSAMDLQADYAGVRGFGFIERKVNGRTPTYVTKFAEPIASNATELAVDPGQNPVLREAMERAVDTGMVAMSAHLPLSDDKNASGFAMFLPVYRNGDDPVVAAQRDRMLLGLIYTRMPVTEIMAGVVEGVDEPLSLELYEGDTTVPGNLLYDSDGVENSGADAQDVPKLSTTRVLFVGGRALGIRVHSTPGFEWSLDYSSLPMLAIGGAMASFLVALTVWLLASGRERAKNLASHMTQELETMARVVRVTDNAVVVTDPHWRITWVNDGFTRMSGYTLEEAVGNTPGKLLGSGKSDPETVARLKAANELGEPCRVELINRTKDGREYWLDTDVHPVRDETGKLVSFMQVGTDITAQKQAQQELLVAQQKVSALADRLTFAIEGGSDGLWDWMDLQSDVQWWSPSYYALLGYTPDEIPASGTNFLSLVHPDMLDICKEGMNLALHHGKPYDQELLLRTKNDGYRWFRSRAKVYRNANGEPFRMAGSSQDVDDRKKAEAEVRRAELLLRGSIDALDDAFALFDPSDKLVVCNQRYRDLYPLCADIIEPGVTFEAILRAGIERGQFNAAVGREEEWLQHRLALHAQQNSDLQQTLADGRILRVSERRMADGHTVGVRVDITDFVRATEAAEAASRSKSQFLANMSHEIRTPMNAILGMLKLLQNTELTPRQQDYAGKTEGAARSLLGLLNDILDFSKVEAGKMTLDPRPFSLDRLLRDLSVILSANVGKKMIEVLFDVDPAVPRQLIGDDMRLQQVLINLGGNAIKFTSHGEVVLRVRVATITELGVVLEFAVQDSGIGIAPENQAHIFSGFSQAEASTTRRFGGTGLGLAISSRLVTLLGGEMQLQSAPGHGSTFSFRIPLGYANTVEATAAPTPEHLAPRTLIVDDNAIALELHSAMASAMGWPTQSASSGTQALELVRKANQAGEPFQVIFVDWQMPDMDGWHTLEAIRSEMDSAKLAQPLQFMVTAHGREMLAEQTTQFQAMLNGFLVKPVTQAMLRDAVLDGKAAAHSAAAGHNPAQPRKVTKVQRLQGMRLLVVEDNKINQVVAQGLLSQEGAIVTLADNGRLGVDAVLTMQPAYDAVLMDLQMPVMDGFEATRAIRATPGLDKLPIIAMTANAMASDREACLAAGMNDHVGKPFELDHLVATLLQRTGREAAAPAHSATNAATPAPTRAWPDPGQFEPGDLDSATALARVGGDKNMYRSVLQSFANDLPRYVQQVRDALASGSDTEAARGLHTLKGLAATVGARHVSAVAAQLETRVKAGLPSAEHATALAQLQDAIDAMLPNLHEVLKTLHTLEAPKPKSDTGAGPDRAQLQRDLEDLARLLDASDMVALEANALVQKKFGDEFPEALQPLQEAMSALDFAQARKICEDVITKVCR